MVKSITERNQSAYRILSANEVGPEPGPSSWHSSTVCLVR